MQLNVLYQKIKDNHNKFFNDGEREYLLGILKEELDIYMFDEEHIKNILERISKRHYFGNIWDKDDRLSESNILAFIKLEEYLYPEWMYDIDTTVNYILDNGLKGIEKHPKIREKIEDLIKDSWEYNEDELILHSTARLRLSIASIDINDKEYTLIKEMMGDSIDWDTFARECEGFSYYNGYLTYFFDIQGKDIIDLRQQYQEGYIIIPEGSLLGIHNSFCGSSSYFGIKVLKPLKIVINEDTDLDLDSRGYGVQEVNMCGKLQDWRA